MVELCELSEFFEDSWASYGDLGDPKIVELEASSFAGTKARLLLQGTQSSAFASLSPSNSPDLVADDIEMIDLARSELGPELSSVVPAVLFAGRFQGRSVAVFELLNELPTNRLLRKVQRTKIAALLVDWVDQVAVRTLAERPSSEFENSVQRPLDWIGANSALSGEIRQAAKTALSDFQNDPTTAKTVFMHGDLWWGNVMLPTSAENAPAEFLVIDWGGAKLNGYPVYDLVRAMKSSGTRNIRAAIEHHLGVIKMSRQHGLAHVLCAAGSYGVEGGQLTPERSNDLVEYCFEIYTS